MEISETLPHSVKWTRADIAENDSERAKRKHGEIAELILPLPLGRADGLIG
jgi:hypothetical protein